MSRAGYYGTILIFMVLGGLAGMVVGAAYGFLGHEVGWWGVGLLTGLFYGVIAGFSLAERP